VNSLVSISNSGEPTQPDLEQLSAHRIRALPVLVIFPHNQCNCRCVMCGIWRIREARQITAADIERQIQSLRELRIRWTVFSGGEPQLNEKWSCLAQMLRAIGCRVTLLTAGLLLKSQTQRVIDSVDDVIISFDGPPAIHDGIRRVKAAFAQVAEGIQALRQLRPDIPIRARCTVQKANHRHLRAVIESAKEVGFTSVSFLAADLTSEAFNRVAGWLPERRERVALTPEEADKLEAEVEQLIFEHRTDIDSGFVAESAEKLRRIVRHFRAHLNQTGPLSPRCNAPWVSAVIEASGDVRPCFFHPVVGNIHRQELAEIVNGQEALHFRASLDVRTNPICQRCVCSLHMPREDEFMPEEMPHSNAVATQK